MLSPVVEKEISQYYKARNGNLAGIPVVVLGLNTDETSEERTDDFIQSVGFELVLDDLSWKGYAQFGPGGAASRYVIINGVANSPGHRQWEVLFNQNYFDYKHPEILRTIIDGVKASAPPLPKISGLRRVEGGAIEFVLTSEPGRSYHVEYSTDLKFWTRLATLNPTDQNIVYRDASATAAVQGFYRVASD